jgi:hypothetical protein
MRTTQWAPRISDSAVRAKTDKGWRQQMITVSYEMTRKMRQKHHRPAGYLMCEQGHSSPCQVSTWLGKTIRSGADGSLENT